MKRTVFSKIICFILAMLTLSAVAVQTVGAASLCTVLTFNPTYDEESNTVVCAGTYKGIIQPTRVYMITLVDANNKAISTKNPTGSELDSGNGKFSYSFYLDSNSISGNTMPMKMTLKCVTAGVIDAVTADVGEAQKEISFTFVAGENGTIAANDGMKVPHGLGVDELDMDSFPIATPDKGYYFSGWEYSIDSAASAFTQDTVFTASFKRILGDVNCDGFVDNLDAAMVLRYDAGITNDEIPNEAGDVNNDGGVDNLDAAIILKYDAGLIEKF